MVGRDSIEMQVKAWNPGQDLKFRLLTHLPSNLVSVHSKNAFRMNTQVRKDIGYLAQEPLKHAFRSSELL